MKFLLSGIFKIIRPDLTGARKLTEACLEPLPEASWKELEEMLE